MGTDSQSCPRASFGTNDLEPPGSASLVLRHLYDFHTLLHFQVHTNKV
jgi:hypothetical protein